MRTDSRLSRLLHVLIHMESSDDPMTSQRIAAMTGSNPAALRRMMSGLRKNGVVSSNKGHGGGWKLERPLNKVSLLDVYEALESPEIFTFGLSDDKASCLVEKAVNKAIDDAKQEARMQLLNRFASVNVSDIAADFAEQLTHHH